MAPTAERRKHGRQVTEGEAARPEAEGCRQGRGRGPGEVQARQLPPDAVDSGKGQEVARRCLTHDEAAMKSIANKTQTPLSVPLPRQDPAPRPRRDWTDRLGGRRTSAAREARPRR